MEEADLSKVQSALSTKMESATSVWWNVFQNSLPMEKTHKNFRPLPIAYTSTAYLSQLVTAEIKFEVADEKLNGFVQ